MEEKKKQIILRDVALREAAQVEGAQMSPRDQNRYIQYLIEGGIDQIEVGYPSSTPEQLIRCKEIVKFVNNFCVQNKQYKCPLLSGLAIAKESSIKAVKEAGLDICHIYIPASEELLQAQFGDEKYGNTPEEKCNWVMNQANIMVILAKSLGFKKVEYSSEDARRAGRKFLCATIKTVIEAGVDYINIPDTTGLSNGAEFSDLIKYVNGNVSNINQVEISVHCHNDSDHSTTNALQAILAGATQIEGTFYGLGERSGMTKFEAVIMNIETRADLYGEYKIAFKKQDCYRIVNFIANALGMPVPRHWVVVGVQNGICSSGTHQAIEKRASEAGKKSPYYSWDPSQYGHAQGVKTVINKSSGRDGVMKKIGELGIEVGSEDRDDVYDAVMRLSESNGGVEVDERELVAVVDDVVSKTPFPIKVSACQVVGGEGTIPTATVVLLIDGESFSDSAISDGPYDAVMKAIERTARKKFPQLGNVKITLDDWNIGSVTEGSNASADVYSRIRVVGKEDAVFVGRAVNRDTTQAIVQSFANCIGWYLNSIKEYCKN